MRMLRSGGSAQSVCFVLRCRSQTKAKHVATLHSSVLGATLVVGRMAFANEMCVWVSVNASKYMCVCVCGVVEECVEYRL